VTRTFAADAVLFDSDGVLVDSTAAGERAWVEWARRRDIAAEVVLDGLHGRRSRETVALRVPADDVDAATAEIDGIELASAGETRRLPGAAELLASIPDLRHAVVTSAGRALGEARLRAAGVPMPSTVVTSEAVDRGKPAPDPYLAAARALGVPIGRCVVVEDSAHGIAAARAAGASAVVGVGAGALAHDCDVVVADLAALRWTGSGLEVLAPISS
jgi:sugar-phosphatase